MADKKSYEPVVITIQPERIEHEQVLADHLLEGRVVIVDFQKTDTETAQRITSFLEGALYGVNGEMVQLRDDLLLIAPEGMFYKEKGQ
ncbi:cell division protein SepF [Candidatus Margulisiibacteriota bacterium]